MQYLVTAFYLTTSFTVLLTLPLCTARMSNHTIVLGRSRSDRTFGDSLAG